MLKQVICIRKDLNMRKGKMVAQGSHASIGAYLMTCSKTGDAWLESGATKICVGVDSEDDLLKIKELCEQKSIICYLVIDAGKTEFKQKTITSLGIGPFNSDIIDLITGNLKLL